MLQKAVIVFHFKHYFTLSLLFYQQITILSKHIIPKGNNLFYFMYKILFMFVLKKKSNTY